jgi:hypothetical protein
LFFAGEHTSSFYEYQGFMELRRLRLRLRDRDGLAVRSEHLRRGRMLLQRELWHLRARGRLLHDASLRIDPALTIGVLPRLRRLVA